LKKPPPLLRAALLCALCCALPAAAADGSMMPWWAWPIALFAVSFAIGIVAVVAGVGGGVLFVPIVGGFFPFHLDFVRGAGLLLALTAALSAGPALLRSGLASLRLVMPLALVGSITSILGAMLGFVLPTLTLQAILGVIILVLVALMAAAKSADYPHVPKLDALAAAFGLYGLFRDESARRQVEWRVHRTAAGLVSFGIIGLVGGLFGLGAGWANVPVLNLLMGAPIKLAVGSSALAISIVNTSAAWIYINRGAVLPIVVVPSIIGVMIGARIGVRLLRIASPEWVRRAVIALLAISGARALLLGLGAGI
jgi:uncharacterized membrane protein YfcA